jgi:3-(3-hydroxy-phenyl)propionate hydroxylase
VARTFQFWDRPARRLVAEFDFGRLQGETPDPYVVQTEQHKLADMGIARLKAMPNAEVLLGVRVTGLQQEAERVRVRAEEAGERREFEAAYLIGCTSTTRSAGWG